MATTSVSLEDHVLDDGSRIHVGRLPEHLRPDDDKFESLWHLHPEDYHVIQMHGRPVRTPPWQQAYGADYHYTGRTNTALPVPSTLEPFWEWVRSEIDVRLNGLLLNWYDGSLGHYIGLHHDSTKNMVEGAPIVTLSFGEVRIFRLFHPKRKLTRDFIAEPGAVLVMPFETNLVWKHGVPKFVRHRGRRISLTLRAFHQRA